MKKIFVAHVYFSYTYQLIPHSALFWQRFQGTLKVTGDVKGEISLVSISTFMDWTFSAIHPIFSSIFRENLNRNWETVDEFETDSSSTNCRLDVKKRIEKFLNKKNGYLLPKFNARLTENYEITPNTASKYSKDSITLKNYHQNIPMTKKNSKKQRNVRYVCIR